MQLQVLATDKPLGCNTIYKRLINYFTAWRWLVLADTCSCVTKETYCASLKTVIVLIKYEYNKQWNE